MSSKEKDQERTVVMPPSPTEKNVFTVTALRMALDQLAVSEHQTELILMKLFDPSSSSAAAAAAVVAAPSAVKVAATSGTHAAAAAVDNDVDTTHGSDDFMDDELDADVDDDDDDDDDDNDDDDDDDDDSNVPFPPQSKIQYDSDDDSVEDFEFSQQVNYN